MTKQADREHQSSDKDSVEPSDNEVTCPLCQGSVSLLSLLEQKVADAGGDVNLVALKLLSEVRGGQESSSLQISQRTSGNKRKSPRPAKPRSTFWGTLIGAIAAFPCAQLILWWVFSVDPFGLAAPISERLPSVVPPVLRVEPQKKEEPKPTGPMVGIPRGHDDSNRLC